MANYFEDPNYIRLNDTDWQVLDAYDYWKGPRESPLLSERCIEIALAFRWIDLMNNDIVEVGAVTPYHTISKTLSHPIIDPYDKKATIQDFVENQDLTMDNVLSISTKPTFSMLKIHILERDFMSKCLENKKNRLRRFLNHVGH